MSQQCRRCIGGIALLDGWTGQGGATHPLLVPVVVLAAIAHGSPAWRLPAARGGPTWAAVVGRVGLQPPNTALEATGHSAGVVPAWMSVGVARASA